MRNKAFFVNGIILTLSSIFINVLNMLYSIFISNKIGAEGMGLYQLVSSVYVFTSTLASSGVGVAVTMLVSSAMGKNPKATGIPILKRSVCISLFLGIVTALLLFSFAEPIGVYWLKDERTILSLKVLAPSLPCMALSACLRGYFIARGKASHTGSSQIVEHVTSILICVFIINLFIPSGLEYACCGVVIGLTLGEIISFLYAFMLYHFYKKGLSPDRGKQTGIFKNIMQVLMPVYASSNLRTGLKSFENTLIPSGLKKFGASSAMSLSQYGVIKGMVMPMLLFPSTFIGTFSNLLVPEIAQANAQKNKSKIDYINSKAFQLTLLLSIFVTGIFIFFAKDIGMALYNNNDAVIFLRILAPLVPLIFLEVIAEDILQGLNQQTSSLKYNLADSLMRIGLIYFAVPCFGISAFVVVMYLSNLLTSLLSIHRLIKISKLKLDIGNWIIKPCISIFMLGLLLQVFFTNCCPAFSSYLVTMTIKLLLALVLYILILFICGSIRKNDIIWAKDMIITMFTIGKKEKKVA